jgi:hypothetical protein
MRHRRPAARRPGTSCRPCAVAVLRMAKSLLNVTYSGCRRRTLICREPSREGWGGSQQDTSGWPPVLRRGRIPLTAGTDTAAAEPPRRPRLPARRRLPSGTVSPRPGRHRLRPPRRRASRHATGSAGAVGTRTAASLPPVPASSVPSRHSVRARAGSARVTRAHDHAAGHARTDPGSCREACVPGNRTGRVNGCSAARWFRYRRRRDEIRHDAEGVASPGAAYCPHLRSALCGL